MEFKRQSYSCLDYGRMFFAVICLLGHCGTFKSKELFGNIDLYFSGCIGCMINPYFFALTGFFMGESGNLTGRKILQRAYKFIKLYVLWTIIYLPIRIISYLRDVVRDESLTSFRFILRQLKSFLFGNYPLWWLKSAAISILIFYLLYKLLHKNIKLILCLSCILYLYSSLWRYMQLLNLKTPYIWYPMMFTDKYIDSATLSRSSIFYGLAMITIGVYINELKNKNKLPSTLFCFCGLVISYIAGLFEVKINYILGGYDTAAVSNALRLYAVFGCFFTISFLIGIEKRFKQKNTKGIRQMSALIYYMHYLILYLLTVIYHRLWFIPKTYFNLILGLTTLAAAVLLSTVLIKTGKDKKIT